MNLVGPLPKSARGHQNILADVDFATQYSKAISSRKMSSKGKLSHIGVHKEILTDQGPLFMSKVTK